MIQQTPTVSFRKQLLEGVHDFRTTGNIFRIALFSSTATLNSSTTAYSSSGEVDVSGYTAGGATLTNVNPSSSGTTGFTSFSTVTWAVSGLTARGALIYNSDAIGYTNPSVMVLDFGMDRSSLSGVFTITFPTFNSSSAIIRVS
jgi:hypothetical protein